ncbi:MAG TPA: hypothetical protein VMF91_26055 [Bryobacteraceae bacterium]|nr:hypothetical protein [Bryobacteraceae bacterium]
MSFEESIEKLKERHEALRRTVEVTVVMHKANEILVKRVCARIDALVDEILGWHGNLPPSQN